jgi:hypothetical protein
VAPVTPTKVTLACYGWPSHVIGSSNIHSRHSFVSSSSTFTKVQSLDEPDDEQQY